MSVRLLVKSKAATGGAPPEELTLDGDRLTIGRDKNCSVVLNESVVSRSHAQIVCEGVLYLIEDLGSSFGTRVNGVELPAGEKRLLRNGDVIAIGPFDLTFDRVADAVAAVPADEKTSFVARRVIKDAIRSLTLDGGPFLRVMNGPLEGRRIELRDLQEIVIGRDEGVEVRINDELASRRHAKIRRDWSGTHVEDLGSRNGIKINGRRVTEQTLKDRDELEVGSTRFLYVDPTAVRDVPVRPPEEKPGPPIRLAPAAAEPRRPTRAPPAPEPEPDPEPDPDPEPESEAAEGAATPDEPESSETPSTRSEDRAGDDEDSEEEGPGDEESSGDSHSEDEAPEEEDEEHAEPAAKGSKLGSLGGRLSIPEIPGGWRHLVPMLLVVGLAVCAIAVLAVTFFVL